MRRSAKEEYLARLQSAVDDLRAIDSRFRQRGDLVAVQNDLTRWKEETEALIETYDTPAQGRAFRSHVDFDVLGLSGGHVVKGMGKYEAHLRELIGELPTTDVKRGYSKDIQRPLEEIDELSEQLADIIRRATLSGQRNNQPAASDLARWKDNAYRVLTRLIGDELAGQIHTLEADAGQRNADASLEGAVEMYTKYLVDLKEDIQKYPHHLSGVGGTAESSTMSAIVTPTSYVDETRLRELRAIGREKFDLSRLIRLCEELNIAWREGAYHAVAMLGRAVLDHVPPIFGVRNFGQVASNYSSARSFLEVMGNLETAARKIGDAHLHTQVREREVLPNATQVNHASQLDLLLAEIVRLLK